MGTLMKQRINQHEQFVEEDEDEDDDNDSVDSGALIFENTLYVDLLMLIVIHV